MPSTLTSRHYLLLAWTAVVAALQASNGFAHTMPLVVMIAGFVLLVISGEAAPSPTREEGRWPGLVLLAVLALGFTQPPGAYLAAPWMPPLYHASLAAMIAATLAVIGAPARGRLRALAVVGAGLGVMLRGAIILASPAPEIDVFVMFQQSAANLLAGLNPYATPLTGPIPGGDTYGYTVFGYAYLPLNLYAQTLSYAISGDVRWASVAAEALALLALAALGRGGDRGLWAVLLMAFMPRALFVTELAFTEPLIVAAFAAVVWLAARHPGSRRLAVAYGLLLGLKQYLVYNIINGLILERRPGRILIAAVAGALTALPFLVADARAFLDYGLLFQLKTPFRPDGLTIPSLLHAKTGLVVGKGVAALVGLVVTVAAMARYGRRGLAGWIHATALTAFAMFLAGSQAFANYYYLVATMMLFAWVLPETEAPDARP